MWISRFIYVFDDIQNNSLVVSEVRKPPSPTSLLTIDANRKVGAQKFTTIIFLFQKIENAAYFYWIIHLIVYFKVSFGSTSPALSDRSEFPLFFRTVAPDSSHNPARIAFIRRFGWDTITTFSQNEEIHSLAVNDLVTELENANISCAATITFAETDFKNQLKMLRVRIII